MKEFDIFIPLNYNDGTPVEAKKLRDLRVRRLEYFNGATFFPQANKGYWRMGNVTYRDDIVLFRVVTGAVRAARCFLRQLKKEMKRIFKQEEIFIVERDVNLL